MTKLNQQALFISFEGGEASGKTTLSKMLAKYMLDNKYEYVLTREPGGTYIGNNLRTLLLKYNNLTPETQLLLNMAARAEHLEQIIKPNLAEEKFVITDRYLDSSVAYQGELQGLGADLVMQAHQLFFKGLQPNITFFIDIHPELALKRLQNRKVTTHYDDMQMEKHIKIYESYVKLAEQDSERIIRIDGKQELEVSLRQIIQYLTEYK